MIRTVTSNTQVNRLLERMAQAIDLSKSQYDIVKGRYDAVAKCISSDPELTPFEPVIHPHGSWNIGTTIRPVCEEDELDVDLISQLTGKRPLWTQKDVKNAIGDALKRSGIYGKMLDKEGRRCWTVVYHESANFHLDVLPAIIDQGQKEILAKAFSTSLNEAFQSRDELAIRITDKFRADYETSTNTAAWLRSNPLGYAIWFRHQAAQHKTILLEDRMFSASVNPFPDYEELKLPLQRIVQILKRHRDIFFEGKRHKTISVIITTLAARFYRGQDLQQGLSFVLQMMDSGIESRYDSGRGKFVKWVSNPVDAQENFADKWAENQHLETAFYSWLEAAKRDLVDLSLEGVGLKVAKEKLEKAFDGGFGQNIVAKAFEAETLSVKDSILLGTLGTTLGGTLSSTAKANPPHKFHGS